ncbi:hypothetical protein C8Q70DRAFT_906931 [Cubamyces menziesii]|nr:hypothetical protein C8Q70DRAFT_906931 [Cubamyces menziesii]
MIPVLLAVIAAALPLTSAHIAFWHPSIYGFNVTEQTFPYDNRPVVPLQDMTFQEWWFHNHLAYPPNPGDVFEFPAGKAATAELACNKGATTWFNSSEGGDIRNGNDPCPGSPPSEYHTTGFNDLKGCAMAIAYEPDVTKIQPEDFVVFSVNQTCVWNRFTDFQVPARMPACPEGGCHCAWFWIHSPDSGSEQIYMNGFKCEITGASSTVPLAKPKVARRCGADPDHGKPDPVPGNCTYGAKQPLYWLQKERNNEFEDAQAPPFYNDVYNFLDGAQDDIFEDSYPNGIPDPSPEQTIIPTPVNAAVAALTSTPSSAAASASASPSSSSPSSSTASTTSTGGPRPSARGFRRSTGSPRTGVPRKPWTQSRKMR